LAGDIVRGTGLGVIGDLVVGIVGAFGRPRDSASHVPQAHQTTTVQQIGACP